MVLAFGVTRLRDKETFNHAKVSKTISIYHAILQTVTELENEEWK